MTLREEADMALSATGLGSGLDIEGLVTRLMEAERLPPERRLLNREAQITSDISSLGTLKSSLADLRDSLSSVNSLATFEKRNASSSDSTKVAVTATSKAVVGDYQVSVSSLATQQSLAIRNEFSSTSETVGTGTLSFTFGATGYTADGSNNTNDTYDSFSPKAGAETKTVVISSANSSLTGVRDAINAADIGITASIVGSGTSHRLVITSDSTGAENSVQISVTGDADGSNTDASGLSRLSFNATVGTSNVYQTQAASDAAFTVNGLALTSDTNAAADVIDGVTLTLKETTSGSETVTISDNKSGIKSAITTFIDGYNDYRAKITELTGYDAATGVGGPLQGDFSARTLSSQIRNIVGGRAIGYSGARSSLSELGITTGADGSLALNSTKLDAALDDGSDDVTATFARFASAPDNSGLAVASITDEVDPGTYTVAVSSLASSGSKTSGLGAAPTISSSANTFSITVDGSTSGTIEIAAGAKGSLSALASELLTQINGDATLRDRGKSVTVSIVSGAIEIRSASVGSTSTIRLQDVEAGTVAALGFDTVQSNNGSDLSATINGVAGTASGNVLSGATGSDAEGLSFEVNTVAGGRITVSQGLGNQLDLLLDSMLGSNNTLDSRIDSLQDRISDITDERAALQLRLNTVEARYRRQFNALDALLNEMTNTGSFVSQQLANIPVPGKSKK
jgi:flagellar hook-associated protein 2